MFGVFQNLMDRMNATELAANPFRMTLDTILTNLSDRGSRCL